ncbi:MAG: peptide chain release factor N(5)-glutamine methyltransferase [Planctomycetota bacterium]
MKNKQLTVSYLLAPSRPDSVGSPSGIEHRYHPEKQLLSHHNSDRIDKEIILSGILKCKRVDLYKEPGKIVTPFQRRRFRNLLQKYKQGCPVAYLTGHKEFMSLDFIITKDVLIPRPETELLVEETLKCLPDMATGQAGIGHKTKITILDIGTGSGNIAISIVKHCSFLSDWSSSQTGKKLQILSSDISKRALKIASINAMRHKVQKQIRFCYGDLFKAFNNLSLARKVDIIVSNPPYITDNDFYKLPISVRKYEPRVALFSGPDGLFLIRKIISQSPYYLKPQGYLLLELGQGQSKKVLNLVKSTNNFEDIKILPDYNKIPRVLCAKRI